MIISSDLMDTLKSKKGKYASITITTDMTYYREIMEVKKIIYF